MKKHLSVLSLYIRASLLPIVIVCVTAAAAETALFYAELRYTAGPVPEWDRVRGLEELLGDTVIPYVALGALILTTVLLAIQGTSISSQTSYTMSRLSISESSAFLWQAAYNSLVYLMFWAAEAVLMFALCSWYAAAVGNATGQTVLLALYRDEFLHGLLPLHDVSRNVRNVCLCLSLGTMTAYFTYTQRHGRTSIAAGPMIVYALGSFRINDISLAGDIIHILICLFFTVYVIVKVLTGYSLTEDEDDSPNVMLSK